jgi:hypothetical protein
MTDLTSRILATVADRPGITTNALCKQVNVRKTDILTELDRLRRTGLLRVELGHRASKSWYLAAGRGNQFLGCSWGTPAVELACGNEEVNETDGVP